MMNLRAAFIKLAEAYGFADEKENLEPGFARLWLEVNVLNDDKYRKTFNKAVSKILAYPNKLDVLIEKIKALKEKQKNSAPLSAEDLELIDLQNFFVRIKDPKKKNPMKRTI